MQAESVRRILAAGGGVPGQRGGGLRAREGAIRGRQRGQKTTEKRDAVHHDVMRGDHQAGFLLAHDNKQRANKRSFAEVERPAGMLRRDAVDLGLALVRR